MNLSPLTVDEPRSTLSPLVVDSPHSGRLYPDDFHYACPLTYLRQTEDFHVDELIDGALEAGATVIKAGFPRCYIDVNRAVNDIDPAVLAEPWPTLLDPSDRTLQGLGLVRRLCKSGVPVYAAPLRVADVQKRIATFYDPYHAALEKAVSQRLADFGICYLIDCHSMPDRGSESRGGEARSGAPHIPPRPDFVLGDRQGSGCDPSFTRRARDRLQDMGYTVTLNDPYRGMEIVKRYGRPDLGRQALQLEINRRLYMDEASLTKHDGFLRLQRDLTSFFCEIAQDIMRDMPDRLAAE